MKTDKRTLPRSNKVIKQISETKKEKSRQELLTKTKSFRLKQSNKQLAKPTHRKKKHISLEKYQKLLKEGKSVPEIIQTTSKHLIYFYNTLLKGKINLTKEEFKEKYNNGISLDKISKEKNIPREHLTFLREFYGIKRKGATFQRRLKNEKPLNRRTKDIIIGSLLGDGGIGRFGYFYEKHSEKQVGYLEWKGAHFKNILTPKSYSCYVSKDKRSGTTIYSFSLRTITHNFIKELERKFYKIINGKKIKIIPNDIEKILNKQVLAIWFMDDGNTDWLYRNGIKKCQNATRQCKISSQSFTLEENKLLQKILLKKWGLKTNIRFRNKEEQKLPVLRFDCISSKKLTKILKPFATKELLYKFDEKEHLKHRKKIFDKEKILQSFKKRHNLS